MTATPSTVYCPLGLQFCHFKYTATTEISTLSLHDALPIFAHPAAGHDGEHAAGLDHLAEAVAAVGDLLGHVGHVEVGRSEEHTSELQSHVNLVCRLLLEKKKQLGNG